MQHRVTVGAHWAEVSDGIHDVLTSQVGERTEVMDVDEAFNLRPVDQSKAKGPRKNNFYNFLVLPLGEMV